MSILHVYFYRRFTLEVTCIEVRRIFGIWVGLYEKSMILVLKLI